MSDLKSMTISGKTGIVGAPVDTTKTNIPQPPTPQNSATNSITSIEKHIPTVWDTPGKTIIGVTNIRLVPSHIVLGTTFMLPSEYTVEVFDTTTYIDRALLRFGNTSSGVSSQTEFGIIGKRIAQLGGKNGYIWEYSNYDDIEKNGENYVEIASQYIMNDAQVEDLGDFWTKELAKHDIYTLTLLGAHPYLVIGDLWTIDIEYQLPSATSETENIYVDAEIIGLSISRNAGDIGATQVNLRVPSGAWSKTTSRPARLVSSGQGAMLENRGNEVLVASKDYAGQADYYCDGIADDVQIQMAIDYMGLKGGGTVFLTEGGFTIADTIDMEENVILSGAGANTVLYPVDNTVTTMIDFGVLNQSLIEKMLFNGNGTIVVYPETIGLIKGTSRNGSIDRVTVTNFNIENDSGTHYSFVFNYCRNISNTRITGNTITNNGTEARLYGYYYCENISDCFVENNEANGDDCDIHGYRSVYTIEGCVSDSNSCTGDGDIYSFVYASRLSICCSKNNTSVSGDVYSYSNCENRSQCTSED